MQPMDKYVDETFIETFTGKRFGFLDPQENEVEVYDIANALSKSCRYVGHVSDFYSVAEHCCHLYDFYWDRRTQLDHEDGHGVDYGVRARTVLMHDASEAYLADIARPVKKILPDYQALEAKIEGMLAQKFNLIYPFPVWLKELDTRILLDERKMLQPFASYEWAVDKIGVKPLGVKLQCWSPAQAAREYLHRYNQCKS
jgi:uncharacterized protein